MGGNTGTIAAGVAVGVIVALVLLVCICLAVVVLRKHLRKEQALAIKENEKTSYPNAVYRGHGMLLIIYSYCQLILLSDEADADDSDEHEYDCCQPTAARADNPPQHGLWSSKL